MSLVIGKELVLEKPKCDPEGKFSCTLMQLVLDGQDIKQKMGLAKNLLPPHQVSITVRVEKRPVQFLLNYCPWCRVKLPRGKG
jgi:hypothetical protein